MSHIQVRTSFEGVHQWLNAPDEVAFLRNLHRHVFNVEVCCEVFHSDRELEFFMVRQTIDTWMRSTYPSYHNHMPDLKMLGTYSCEQIASDIQAVLFQKYKRKFSVVVREDYENAGGVQ